MIFYLITLSARTETLGRIIHHSARRRALTQSRRLSRVQWPSKHLLGQASNIPGAQTSTFTAQKKEPNRKETDQAYKSRFELAVEAESAGLELNVFGFAAIPPNEHRWP
jgi:hypothetical protein